MMNQLTLPVGRDFYLLHEISVFVDEVQYQHARRRNGDFNNLKSFLKNIQQYLTLFYL